MRGYSVRVCHEEKRSRLVIGHTQRAGKSVQR